jgi:FSR family fosmidomycin resistance protein-like MFS transporter
MALGIASVGIAMYHPEGVRYASWVSAASGRQGRGMSFFAVGGMSGWALGPILVTPLALLGGLRATCLIAVVPLAAAIVLARALPLLARYRPVPGGHGHGADAAASQWGVFGVAAVAASLRTGMHFGVQAFVPLYLWHVLRSSEATANAAGTTLLIAGAAGTLIGGRLADRYGFRRVVVWSFLTVVPLVASVTVAPVWGVFVLMGAIGLVEEMNFYPLVVIAQRAVPRHVGFASGVVLGLSIGFGALTTWLLGVLADGAGLRATIVAEAALMALAFLFAVALPRAPAGRMARATA